ncbi:hypothetical protein HD806DRAFT_540064 [Xylariaceae sp. AK1471]|nr:hypothetical protein HD806DRAFT_540064 [Xylariaceae sp. AK1471]
MYPGSVHIIILAINFSLQQNIDAQWIIREADTSNSLDQPRGSGTSDKVEKSESVEASKLLYTQIYSLEGVEDVEEYRPGDLRPVNMFDMLGDRFDVCHRLGSGDIATVWFCYEEGTRKRSSIKTSTASRSHDESPELRVAKALKESGVGLQLLEDNHIAMSLETF